MMSDGRVKQPGGCPQDEQIVSDGSQWQPDAFVRRMAATRKAHDRVPKKAG